jgi:transcriptional regulator with XRE-family HTH domain
MARKTVVLSLETKLAIEKMGVRIKKARLRRNVLAEALAELVGISKGTLSSIEKGEPTVSIGAYATVLNALDMIKDLELVAVDREGRKNYQGMRLQQRKRATKQNDKK